MSVFEFTFGLIAIILGLALTDIATSLHRLVMNRARVKWHPLPLLAAALALWAVILQWWTAWESRAGKEQVFSSLVYAIAQALVLFLMAAASLPDKGDEGEVDLGAHYDKVRPYYMSLALIMVMTAGVVPSISGLVEGQPYLGSAIANGVLAVAFAVCIFVRRRWVNTAVLALIVLLLAGRWGLTELRG
ncbi:MAG: hypothetical protein JWP35_3271 [Caulobacter sp.]|nr:hypothetical protein [Caulobacter sp.]